MRKQALILVLFAVACDRPPDEQQIPTGDTAGHAIVTPAPDTTSSQTRSFFDPNSVSVGSTTGGLQVTRKDVTAAPDSRLGVTGSLGFKGELELLGSYRAHFDYPEVKVPCFWVDMQDWKKLPRVRGDDRLIWFCFRNQEDAIRQLGALGTQTRATIIIDDYTTNLQQSDVWDEATLVRVVRKGG